MTRILPNPLAGQHPLCPDPPAPLSDNPCLEALSLSGTVSCFLGAAGAIFGARSGILTIRAAAYSSALLTGFGYGVQFLESRMVRDLAARVEGVEVKPKRRVLFERTGSVDIDDCIIGGAAIGTALALNRRAVPGVVGWSRFLGMASIGSAITSAAFTVYSHERTGEANSVRKQQIAEKRRLRTQYRAALADKHRQSVQGTSLGRESVDEHRSKETERASHGGRTPWQLPKIVKQIFEQPGPKPDAVLMEAEVPRPSSVGGPHMAVPDEGGPRYVPVPDYSWSPNSRKIAQESLEEHLRNLIEKKDRLTSTANYLWCAVIDLETKYYLERKDEQKAALMWLNSIHFSACQDLTETSWLIADSAKRLTLLDGWPSLRAEPDNEERVREAKEYLDRKRLETSSSIWREKSQRVEAVQRAVEFFEDGERMTLRNLAAMQNAKARFLTETAAARDDTGSGAYALPSMDQLKHQLRSPQEEQMEFQLEVLRELKRRAQEDLERLSKLDTSAEAT